MTPALCQCGTPKTFRNGAEWCTHCDQPHRDRVGGCVRCATAKRSLGIGPGTPGGEP